MSPSRNRDRVVIDRRRAAWVDDAGRITESNASNNKLTVDFVVHPRMGPASVPIEDDPLQESSPETAPIVDIDMNKVVTDRFQGLGVQWDASEYTTRPEDGR